MSIVKDIICEYPGCTAVFFGDDHQKYCKEHSKDKYRYSRTSANATDTEESPNVTIKHASPELFTIGRACDCCGNEYRITLYPKQSVYPRYCNQHRNKYRRDRFKEISK